MRTTVLILEFLIVGFLVSSVLFFLTLLVTGTKDFGFVKDIEGYFTPIGVGLTLFSYAAGVVFYRLTDLARLLLRFRFLRKLLGLEDYYKSKTKEGEWDYRYFTIYQYGSDNLVDKIEYNVSLLRMYRGVSILSPVAGTLIGVWLMLYQDITIGVIILLTFILGGIFSVLAHRLQFGHFEQAMILSVQILEKEFKKTNSE